MAELILEPFTAVQHWHRFEGEVSWEEMLAGYLQALAQGCAQSSQAVIGHIKALALFSAGEYLQVSVVAPDRPASTDGHAPPGITSLELTLNVLVYGLGREQIEQLVVAKTQEISARWGGEIISQSSNSSGHTH